MQYSDVLNKLFILDLDELKPLIEPFYSTTGRPAENQAEIFRSFILMSALKVSSIPLWVNKLKANPILHNMIGLTSDEIPGVGTHYDFINRFWLNSDGIFSKSSKLKSFKRKARGMIRCKYYPMEFLFLNNF